VGGGKNDPSNDARCQQEPWVDLAAHANRSASDLSSSVISFMLKSGGNKWTSRAGGRIRLRLKPKPRSFGEALFLSGVVFFFILDGSWSVPLVLFWGVRAL